MNKSTFILLDYVMLSCLTNYLKEGTDKSLKYQKTNKVFNIDDLLRL